MYTDILILGAGPAGYNAAKAACQSGKDVVLAGEEPFLPYWRPRLPELIHTGGAVDSILIQDAAWYVSHGIRFRPSKKAAAIDPAGKAVRWEDGGTTEYGSLILACGSSANIPKLPFAENPLPLRNYNDAKAIRDACGRTGKAFVVGGGVLGLETAFAIAQAGYRVAVCDIHDYPLPRQLDREGGLFLKNLLEEKGIRIYAGAAPEEMKGDLEDACVIAAAGVHPSISIARQCGIRTDRGILVDECMRTSADGIYACGDIAEFSGVVPGLMTIAAKQGETAGSNASGADVSYHALLPSPMMKIAGISVLSIGCVEQTQDAQILRSTGSGGYAMAVVKEGKITGAAFIGNTALGMKFKKFMEIGADVGPVSSFDALAEAIG